MTRALHRPGIALILAAALAQFAGLSRGAVACGMLLVAPQAETKLVSTSSKVVLAWDRKPDAVSEPGNVALTIAVDYHSAPKEFVAVIPVPTFLERKQISIVDISAIDLLDALTAPRLREDYDSDPCAEILAGAPVVGSAPSAAPGEVVGTARHQGVTVEAKYDVGEYDISILSATQSKDLLSWLTNHGYKLPVGAAQVLGSYISQGMRFFVAKVNLDRMPLLAGQFLRPLQVRYQATKLVLPVRLGMINANGPQDLIIFALSRSGRVEVSNYDTVKMPTGMDLPLYIKEDFGKFYNAVFDRITAYDMASAYLESVLQLGTGPAGTWVVGPWKFESPSIPQLNDLGARWIGSDRGPDQREPNWNKVILTRLHVRYDSAHFPYDLEFRETDEGSDFQTLYLLRHAWNGASSCPAAKTYRRSLPERYAREARDLAQLTGWPEDEIRARMAATGEPPAKH